MIGCIILYCLIFINLQQIIKHNITNKLNNIKQQSIVMLRKTQISEAQTNYTDKKTEGGASSFLVNKRRQMYEQLKQNQLQNYNKSLLIEQDQRKYAPKNVLLLQPKHARSITWPQVFMPDQQTYVTLKGNFYTIKDSRNKQRFVNRRSKPNSEIIYFNVEKNGMKLIISSVQKFIRKEQNKQEELWYHFHISILNTETQFIQQIQTIEKGFIQAVNAKQTLINKPFNSKQIGNVISTNHLKQTTTQNQNIASKQGLGSRQSISNTSKSLNSKKAQFYFLQFKGLQLIDNCKKAFAVFQPLGKQKNIFYIFMIDFTKKPNQVQSNKKILKSNKIVGKFQLQKKQGQKYIKLINSQYGDIVLLVTTEQIYQIEISGQFKPNQYSLILKPFVVYKIFKQNKNTYISNQTNQLVLSKQMFKKQQSVVDAQYVMNGLKIMILTSHGRVFVLQSQQCLFSQSLYEVLSPKQMVEKYNIQNFIFKKIYFLRGMLIIQVQAQRKEDCNLLKQIKYEHSILERLQERNKIQQISRGFLIAKVQSNSLSFSKFIELPFSLKDYQYFRVHPFKETDQILVQTIHNKDLQSLQLNRCQILSNKNNFIPFSMQNIIPAQKINISLNQQSIVFMKETDKKGPLKISFGKSNKTVYGLKGNQISGYRIYDNQLANSMPKGIKKTLNASFFQKPLKVITNPLTGYVVVLYKQFLKFFINTYTQLKLFHVINIRNISDISFSKNGQYLIICLNDNSIHFLNSYNFKQTKIMDFYGDIKQAYCASQYILSVKSSKNIINIFMKKQHPQIQQNPNGRGEFVTFYTKLYDIKIQSEDIYFIDQNYTVVIKADGSLQFYSHIAEDRTIKNPSDQKQVIRLSLLSKQHANLINKKKIKLQHGQYCTYLFYSSQFSTLFVGTNYGNIIQYLYPFLSIQDPSPPTGYKYKASNNAIIYIQLNGDFSSIYGISQLGQFMQFELIQFLNGIKKNAIYTLSKNQVSQTQLKYQFANRNYLMDNFTTIQSNVKLSLKQQYEQVSFIDDKLKDDIQDTTNKIKNESGKQIQKILAEKKKMDAEFKCQFSEISLQLKSNSNKISQRLEQVKQNNNKAKQQQIQLYEKQLLQIYKQNDRLKEIKNIKQKQYKLEISEMKKRFQIVLNQQIAIRIKESAKLEEHYQQLSHKYETYKQVTITQVQQNTYELDSLKVIQQEKLSKELQGEQLKKQSQLSKISKIEKEIEKYKKRSIYFESLIVQTNNQIQQLVHDINLYEQKKNELKKQLNQKQIAIQDKQKQIVKYLKNTNQMKKVKNIHQFQLQQFQSDILPVQTRIKNLQQQVQKMNFQIMKLFDSKVEQNSIIQNSKKRIQKLKLKAKQMKDLQHNQKINFLRFTQNLSSLLRDPFQINLRKKLAKILDKFSTKHQTFIQNQQLQRGKKESQKLIRKKNMLRKAIQQQQKQQQGILKNKNQFFRYYVDNTNVVKQYNQLFRDHNMLLQQKKRLQQKIAFIKNEKNQSTNTPMKRTKSMHIRKISQKKLTPFQRYEQDQFEFGTLKIKDTTQTKVSRGEDSKSFLKSLIKDINVTSNNQQKAGLVRERIRTFVNPQMSRKKQIQKQLFQRQRGVSNHVVLKL